VLSGRKADEASAIKNEDRSAATDCIFRSARVAERLHQVPASFIGQHARQPLRGNRLIEVAFGGISEPQSLPQMLGESEPARYGSS
jgi:hypothetical protein